MIVIIYKISRRFIYLFSYIIKLKSYETYEQIRINL